MAFKKMKKQKYPPRQWSIVGYPGSGKSTFAAQMKGPILVVDADHRFSEVIDLASGEVYELSDQAHDNLNPDTINRLLRENMPGSDVSTIVVDSLTAIITPYVVQAIMDRENGRTRNLMSAFKAKALAMRQLQDAVTCWGTDVLWIYHLQDGRDANANAITRKTVTQTELARLTRSINLQLEIIQENDRRGVIVTWARRGRSGIKIWDDTGFWQGMPERIEESAYAGLSRDEQRAIERSTPQIFPNSETAITWGFEQGGFAAIEETRRTYETVKRDNQPQNAQEMAMLWIAEVQARAAHTVSHAQNSAPY